LFGTDAPGEAPSVALPSRYAEAKDAVKRVEKAGFPIHPALKKEIEQREKAAAR
jgi:hypothetical protein